MAASSRWEETLYLSYMVGARYYGIPAATRDVAAIRRELDRYRIEAFVVWKGRHPSYLYGFRIAAVIEDNDSFTVYER